MLLIATLAPLSAVVFPDFLYQEGEEFHDVQTPYAQSTWRCIDSDRGIYARDGKQMICEPHLFQWCPDLLCWLMSDEEIVGA